jgi:hypothetical protein
VRVATAIAASALALLASCPAPTPVEEDVIIEWEDSRFRGIDIELLLAHFQRLWVIAIAEGPEGPWFEETDFFIPDARAVLQSIVEQCHLGETIFQHTDHGMATLTIDDLDLSAEKVRCIRRFERRGISVYAPEHVLRLEDLWSKGILPAEDG